MLETRHTPASEAARRRPRRAASPPPRRSRPAAARGHAAGRAARHPDVPADREGEEGRRAQHDRAAARLGELRRDHERLPEEVRHQDHQREPERQLRARRTRRSSRSRARAARRTSSTSARRSPSRAPSRASTPRTSRPPGSTIPANMKDPQGRWVGDYYGVISFGVNTKVVKTSPTTWADLAKPDYKGQVALNGDPRTAGAAFAGVFAASLANGGSLERHHARHRLLREAEGGRQLHPGRRDAGDDRLGPDADHDRLGLPAVGYKKEAAKSGIAVAGADPDDRRLRRLLRAGDQRDGAAPVRRALWEEFLYSDEGQLLFLKGYTHPARFQDLAKHDRIPAALLKRAAVPVRLREGQVRDRRPADGGEDQARRRSGARRSPGLTWRSTLPPSTRPPRRGPPARARTLRAGGPGCRYALARRRAVSRVRGAVPAPAGGRRAASARSRTTAARFTGPLRPRRSSRRST